MDQHFRTASQNTRSQKQGAYPIAIANRYALKSTFVELQIARAQTPSEPCSFTILLYKPSSRKVGAQCPIKFAFFSSPIN